jgi:hypothetical protein
MESEGRAGCKIWGSAHKRRLTLFIMRIRSLSAMRTFVSPDKGVGGGDISGLMRLPLPLGLCISRSCSTAITCGLEETGRGWQTSRRKEGRRPGLFRENAYSTTGTNLLHGLIDGDLALLHHGHDSNALRVRHPHLVGSEFRGGLEGGKEKRGTGAKAASAPECIAI